MGLENTDQKRGTGKQDIGSSCSSVSIDVNTVMESIVAIGLRNCEVQVEVFQLKSSGVSAHQIQGMLTLL